MNLANYPIGVDLPSKTISLVDDDYGMHIFDEFLDSIEDEVIENALANNIVNPLNKIILKKIEETAKQIGAYECITTAVKEGLNILFIYLPIQFILSIILTESIIGNISPSEVVSRITLESVIKKVLKRRSDPKEISDIIEHLIDTIQISI